MNVVSFYKGNGTALGYSEAHAGAICFDEASHLIYLNGVAYGGGDSRVIADLQVVDGELVATDDAGNSWTLAVSDLKEIVDLQKDVEDLKSKDEELAEAIEELKSADVVEWVPSTGDRKHIVLANHDSILGAGTNCENGQPNGYEGGENLEGETYNLAMVSKWNVADFGSNKLHANINSKDKVTINDNLIVATEDVVEKMIEDAVKELPADLVVKSGSVVVDPEGQEAGTYLKLIIANDEENPVFIPANKLVDTYQGSDYIEVKDYTVSLKVDALKADFGIDSLATKAEVEAVDGKVDAVNGLVAALSPRVDALESAVDAIDASTVKLSAAIGEVPGENEGETEDRYAKDTPIQTVLSDMDNRIAANATSIAAAVAGGVTSIVAGDGISVNSTNSTQPVVSLKLDGNTNLKINENKELSFIWIEE